MLSDPLIWMIVMLLGLVGSYFGMDSRFRLVRWASFTWIMGSFLLICAFGTGAWYFITAPLEPFAEGLR